MEEADQTKVLSRIGLVATAELRIAGLTAVMKWDGREVVLLDAPHALETAGLALVVIDAEATDHLLELVAAFRRMRPSLKLVVLGGDNDPLFIEHTIAAGARGVLAYQASEDDVRSAINLVLDGSIWAPRRVLARLLDRSLEAPAIRAVVHLTRKEGDVLKLLVLGLSNREIAHALSVEATTVKAHIGRLMRKAGVRSRTALSVHALAQKWS